MKIVHSMYTLTYYYWYVYNRMGKDDEIRTIAPKQFRHNEFIMKLFKDRVLLTILHILYY
jgi:hypothetical protein